MQWKHSTSPAPKKAKVVPSAGKVMPSFIWNAKGIVPIDKFQKGKNINGGQALFACLSSHWATTTGRLLLPTTFLPHKDGGIPISALHKDTASRHNNRRDGVMVRASALQLINLGFIFPSRVMPKDFQKWYSQLPCLLLST